MRKSLEDLSAPARASMPHDTAKSSQVASAEAAEAPRPLAGDAARILFAVGLITVGFLAMPGDDDQRRL